MAYIRGGDVFKARRSLQRTLALEPDFMPAILLLAEADSRSGAFRSANDSLLKVLQKDPGNIEAYVLLPEAARTPDDIERAGNLLERATAFF